VCAATSLGAHQLTGRVTDASGRPLNGSVQAFPVEAERARALRILRREEQPTKPDARAAVTAGNYRVYLPTDGLWQIVVSSPGYQALELSYWAVTRDERLPPAQLDPTADRTVHVSVPEWVEVGSVVLSPRSSFERGCLAEWRPYARNLSPDAAGDLVVPEAVLKRGLLAFHPQLGEGLVDPTSASVALGGEETQTVKATLRSAEGDPLAGAAVLMGEGRWPLGYANEKGQLDLTFQKSVSRLEVLAAGEARADIKIVDQSTAEQTFVLPRRWKVRVPIVDLGGDSLWSALVWRPEAPFLWVISNEKGIAEFEDVISNPVDICARQGESRVAAVTRRLLGQERDGSVEPVVVPTNALRGLVTDEDGKPIGGATIRLIGDEGSEGDGNRATTGADGVFRLLAMEPLDHLTIVVSAQNYSSYETSLWKLLQDERPPFRFVLARPAGLTGRLLNSDGSPAEEVILTLVKAESSAEVVALSGGVPTADVGRVAASHAGPDGVFRFTDLPAGTFTMIASRKNRVEGCFRGIDITIAGEERDIGDKVLSPPVTLRGRVVDGSGHPIAGAHVAIQLQSADGLRRSSIRWLPELVTSTQGEFVAEGMPLGEHFRVRASAKDFAKEEVVVDADRQFAKHPEIEIALRSAGSIAGLITNETGDPVAGARVTMWPEVAAGGEAAHRLDQRESVVSGADGSFNIDSLECGRYEAGVQAANYLPQSLATISVCGEGTAALSVRLRNGVVVAGVVVDQAGQPAASVWVHGENSSVFTNDDGTFVILVAREETQVVAEDRNLGRAVASLNGEAVRDLRLVLTDR